MGNRKSVWYKREECQKIANGERSAGTTSTFAEKSLVPEEPVSEIIDVKTISEEVKNTEKVNGKTSRRRKRKIAKNKKLATGVILNPRGNIQDHKIAKTDLGRTTMGNHKSLWSKREECPKIANGVTGANSTFDVKSLMAEESVSEIIDVKTVSEEVESTEKANGKTSRRRKRKITKNNKLATGVILNPRGSIEDQENAKTDFGRSTISNLKSVWSQKEERPQISNGETSTNSAFDVKSLIPEETVSEMIDVKTVSKEVENTEKANGKTPRRRKKITKNKKLATGVVSHGNTEDPEIANRGQQDTPSSEEPPVQSQVSDGQQIGTNIVRSLSRKLTIGNVEGLDDKHFVTRLKKRLLILDVNGLLADIIHPPPKDCKPDIKISRRAIFKRPFLDDFLGFCFERFDVAIWSSRTRKILDPVVDYLLGDLKKKLLFVWDESYCTSSWARSLENHHKFIVFKKLGKIWEANGLLASVNGYYDESNTLLLDDSPYKALLNPKHNGIFPLSYSHKDINDKSLGPDGDLRIYLEGVAASGNVKTYVEQHPFGQRAIDEKSPDWAFYSKVLKKVF